MEHYLIEVAGGGLTDTILVLVRYNKKPDPEAFYELYMAGERLGVIQPTINGPGSLLWKTLDPIPGKLVQQVGEKIEIADRK
jgi:hypothetical protein